MPGVAHRWGTATSWLPGACAALVTGCTHAPPPAPSCDALGVAVEASGPAERRVLGEAPSYEADPMLAARADELARSQRARREVAWGVVARVLTPVTLAETTPVAGASVPAFRTWYDREDVNRLFQHAYAGIGPERRAARDGFDPSELDAALAWNPTAIDEITGWTPERFDEYVASLHGQRTIDGLGGIRRILLSPDAARHVLASYAPITRCLAGDRPPTFVDGPPGELSLARVPVALERCHRAERGPFFVAPGSTLSARLEPGGRGADGARVTLAPSIDGVAGEPVCDADATLGCDVVGGGAYFLAVQAGADVLDGTVAVTTTEPESPAPGCLDGRFPRAAVTLAAHWQRADLGMPLPTFDTSAAALRRRFDAGELSWGEGDGSDDPDDARIYTMTLPVGTSYRLAGFHIRTRELDQWLNITLWWSPDPDTDFGADRPERIRALGGPWSHYKMCVAVDYEERDTDPSGGFGDAPTLAAALAEVHDRASWCSNPYIDAAPGLLRGNCLGCHQHAGSGLAPGEVALDDVRFPDGGRARARNNEPSDGLWSMDVADELGAALRDTVAWWDAAERPRTP